MDFHSRGVRHAHAQRRFRAPVASGLCLLVLTSLRVAWLFTRPTGEELPEDEYERLYLLCRDRKESFAGQQPGTVTFEQWVAVMVETADEDNKKPLFGLF